MAELIGRVVRLQLQRGPLRRNATYDPSALVAVERAIVSGRGFIGAVAGGWMLDVHHADHPEVRGRGLRGLSMGFSSHYAAMAQRFGDLPLGVAGENLIVGTERRWTVSDLEPGVAIHPADGESEAVFAPVRPAEPCLEFASFVLGLPERAARDDVRDELDFLSGGMRGFLVDPARLRSPHPVAVGDEVWTVG